MDQKIMEMACKDYLLAAVTNSKKLRELITFSDQVALAEHIMAMSYKDAVSALMFEGKEITNEQIRDFESKTKKGLKYGAAAVAGGVGTKMAYNAAVKKWGIGKATTLGHKVASKVLNTGNLKRGIILGVGLLYLYRKLSDPCVRQSLKLKNIKQRKLVQHQCQAEACKKVISKLQADIGKCAGANSPVKCKEKIEKELIKWKKRYQKETVKIAQIKSKKGENG